MPSERDYLTKEANSLQILPSSHHYIYPVASFLPLQYSAMPGLKWASEDELIFLITKIETYNAIHTSGKARVRNPRKAAFLNEVYDEFDKLFAGSIPKMDLQNITVKSTIDERKKAMIEVRYYSARYL
jgi:hypothetical protein